MKRTIEKELQPEIKNCLIAVLNDMGEHCDDGVILKNVSTPNKIDKILKSIYKAGAYAFKTPEYIGFQLWESVIFIAVRSDEFPLMCGVIGLAFKSNGITTGYNHMHSFGENKILSDFDNQILTEEVNRYIRSLNTK